jgi:hypothetical protein
LVYRGIVDVLRRQQSAQLKARQSTLRDIQPIPNKT